MLRAIGTAWAVLGIVLALLAVLEFALERPPRSSIVVQPAEAFDSHQPVDLRTYNEEFAWTCQNFATALRWGAFSCWRERPFRGEYINIDGSGLRKTWQPPPAHRGSATQRIFVLGGSTAWGFGNRDDYTIASCLARTLHAQGHEVEVRNYGRLGYVSTQELFDLETELQRGNVPRYCVFVNGFNDVSSAVQNFAPGVTLSESTRQAEFNLLKQPFPAILGIALTRSAVWKTFGGRLRGSAGWNDLSDAPGQQIDGDDLMRQTIKLYQKNVEMAQALGERFRFEALYFWQPLLINKPKSSQQERSIVTEELLTAACAKADELVKAALARQNALTLGPNVHYLGDLFRDPRFDDEYIFCDMCHLTEIGNQAVANAIAAQLAPRLAD